MFSRCCSATLALRSTLVAETAARIFSRAIVVKRVSVSNVKSVAASFVTRSFSSRSSTSKICQVPVCRVNHQRSRALAPFRVEDAFGKALSSDRVDLQSFGAAKQSDRVILRLSSEPALAPTDALRLREAVFTDYLDGALSPEERARFEAHLAECDGCAGYLEDMRRMVNSMSDVPEPPVDAATHEALLRAFRDLRPQ